MKKRLRDLLSRVSEQSRFVAAMCASNSVALSVATIVAFWASRGVSLEEGLWLQLIFAVAIVVLEVPTGYFADYVSRRVSLMVGMFFLMVGELVYGMGQGFYSFLVAELLFAVGISFLSGADEAYLRGSLAAAKREDEFALWSGRLQAAQLYVGGVFTIVGSVLASLSLSAPFMVAGVVAGFGVLLMLSLSEERGEQSPPRCLSQVAKDVLYRNSRLRWLSLASGLMWATTAIAFWQFQPIFEQVGVPLVANGALLFLFSFITGSASWYAGRGQIGASCWARLPALLALAGVLAFVAGWSASIVSVAALAALQAVRGLWGVRFSVSVQREVRESEAATARSVINMAGRGVYAVVTVPATYVVSNYGSFATLLGIGTFALCGALLLLLVRKWYRGEPSV